MVAWKVISQMCNVQHGKIGIGRMLCRKLILCNIYAIVCWLWISSCHVQKPSTRSWFQQEYNVIMISTWFRECSSAILPHPLSRTLVPRSRMSTTGDSNSFPPSIFLINRCCPSIRSCSMRVQIISYYYWLTLTIMLNWPCLSSGITVLEWVWKRRPYWKL